MLGTVLTPPLVLFHGGRLQGPVELRTNAKQMAYGPGFYLTTSYWTAREYRGGNGFVYRITLDGRLNWAHQVRLTEAQTRDFLRAIPKLKRRKEVLADLAMLRARRPDGTVSMVGIMNTLDLHSSYGATVARDVAAALVNAGVDATLVEGANSGNEDWVVLHNTGKVLKVEQTDGPEPDFPRLQL